MYAALTGIALLASLQGVNCDTSTGAPDTVATLVAALSGLCDPVEQVRDLRQQIRHDGYGTIPTDAERTWLQRPRHYLGFLDDFNGQVVRDIHSTAQRTGLDPTFLTVVVFQEGLASALPRIESEGAGYSQAVLNGFGDIGADSIGHNEQMLKDEGYLRPDYDGIVPIGGAFIANEQGERFTSFEFHGVGAAIEGVGAYLAYARDRLAQDVRTHGIDIPPEQLDAWNYVYYNAGPHQGSILLRKYHGRLPETFRHSPLSAINNARLVGSTLEMHRRIGLYDCEALK